MNDLDKGVEQILDQIFGDKEPPDLIDVRTATEANVNAQFKSRWRTIRAEAKKAINQLISEAVIGELEKIPVFEVKNEPGNAAQYIIDRLKELKQE